MQPSTTAGGAGGAPAADCADDNDDKHGEANFRQTRAVLAAFADQGRSERVTTAVGSGALAAGLIGAAITYVAVARADGALTRLNAEDTELAGWVVGAAAVVPAAVMVSSIVMTSPEEERLAAFDAGDQASPERRQARVDEARASLATEASSSSWGAVLGGSALVAGGLGAGALGAYFLLLPHLAAPRGPITHSTGAELIGGGVAALGIGVAVIATSGSSAPTQLQLLE